MQRKALPPGKDGRVLAIRPKLLEGELLRLRQAEPFQHVGALGADVHGPRRLNAQAHHIAQLRKYPRRILPHKSA